MLPGTAFEVSRLALGCGALGCPDHGEVSLPEAMAAVTRAHDLGVNLFDTADVYGLGQSEVLLSKALGSARHDAVIVSKFGVDWEAPNRGSGRARTFRNSSPRRVVEAVEGSLRRLRIEALPLYLIHWPDPTVPVEDTVEALLRCQAAGKIRHFGVSNFNGPQIREASAVGTVSAAEVQYNLMVRSPEHDILPACRELNVAVLAYAPLAQGLLTGVEALTRPIVEGDRRLTLPHFGPAIRDRSATLLRLLERMGEKYGRSPAEVAIRWVLDNPLVSVAIVGAKSPTQLDRNIGALEWCLHAEDREALSQASPDAA
jgi:aryl-alcohol dehydrogenase-like predicted oxidoreductase